MGASDVLYYSNTLFFERMRNWNGICIEANAEFNKDLVKYRKSTVSHYFISDEDGKEIDFAVCGATSGATNTAGAFTRCKDVIKIKTKTLETVLKMYNAPKIIDYLSLDVEGHEYEVLKNFPFNEYIFNCITVDHNEPREGPGLRKKIRALLEANSYVFIKGNDSVKGLTNGPIEDFYVHSSISK